MTRNSDQAKKSNILTTNSLEMAMPINIAVVHPAVLLFPPSYDFV